MSVWVVLHCEVACVVRMPVARCSTRACVRSIHSSSGSTRDRCRKAEQLWPMPKYSVVGPLSAGSALRCAAGVLAGELRRVRSALRRYPGAQAYPRYARGECAGTRARVMPACLLAASLLACSRRHRRPMTKHVRTCAACMLAPAGKTGGDGLFGLARTGPRGDWKPPPGRSLRLHPSSGQGWASDAQSDQTFSLALSRAPRRLNA